MKIYYGLFKIKNKSISRNPKGTAGPIDKLLCHASDCWSQRDAQM